MACDNWLWIPVNCLTGIRGNKKILKTLPQDSIFLKNKFTTQNIYFCFIILKGITFIKLLPVALINFSMTLKYYKQYPSDNCSQT